ncbi:MAG: cohesin domain-containing protein [Patescibacteria group bacterium]
MTNQSGILIVSCFLSLLSLSVQAAEITIDSKNKEMKVGQRFEITAFLDTQKENINAIEGNLLYPPDLFEFKEIKDANSIINFWVEQPHQEQQTGDKQQGRIVFSGITPGGYVGKNGLIFSILFEAKKEGRGAAEIHEARALLNDGKGTEAQLSLLPFQFTISKEAPPVTVNAVIDNERPESFVPEVARDSTLFNNKWFLVFATQDKESGVDHYDLKETRQRFFGILSRWITAESPYLLNDQKLQSYIFVKAVDKKGNARTEKISPQNPLPWYENYENWFVIVLALVIVYAMKKFLWRRYIKI